MKKQPIFYACVLFTLLLLTGAYWNHFDNPFQFDDSHTIENNSAIRSLKNIPSFFMDARTTSSLPANQIYRPGLTTLNAIDYWIGGKPEPQPFYFHISIFISYVLLGILLYFLFFKLFNESFEHKWNNYFALFGAAFYSLHAANAETVNYVIARSDSFSTLMIALSLVIYLYKPNWRKLCIYLIPVTIGFFVKEPTIMVAPLLFIYILLFTKELSILQWLSWKGLKEGFTAIYTLLPLFILVLMLFILSGRMASDTFVPGLTPRWNYMITQPFVIVHYFNNFILPLNLSADTDWAPVNNVFDDRVLIGSFFILAMIATAVYCSTKRILYPIAFGISWFLFALLPTSVMPLAEVLNDHRTFFPYIGLAMAAAWAFGLIVIKFGELVEHKLNYKLAFIMLPLLLLFAHAYGTRQRNKVWSSGESLWYDVTIKSPNNGRGLMNYGLAKMRKQEYTAALDCFERALKILPNYAYLHINMGILKSVMGDQEQAELNYKQALYLDPGNPECYYYYSAWLKSQGRFKDALEQSGAGLKVSPGHIGNKTIYEELQAMAASVNDQLQLAELNAKEKPSVDNFISLSLAHYQKQHYEKCIEAAKEALKLKPDCIEAYNNICSAYNMIGNYDEASKAGQEALKIDSNYQLAKNNVADGLSRKAKVEEALTLIKKDPSEANCINLSLLYYNLGSFQKCADAAVLALKANPNSDAAYNNICSAYNMLKLWDKAIEAGEKGLLINPANQLLKNNLEVSRKGKAGK
ncbi:MAG TPA: tetratricopeptide repeat protein [Bacteroidia bacterium]|jgi:tetratricopeptide (TPR) repeat protein